VLGSHAEEDAFMEPNRPDAENPYAPPISDVNAGTVPAPVEGQLAGRVTRFVAQLVDGLLYLVAVVPALIASFQSGAFREGSTSAIFRTFVSGGLGLISGVAWLGLIVFQAYLIATTGQSIGKRLFKIKIVKVDGAPVNFVSGVLVRNWLMMILQQVPGVNLVLPLTDALFIFRRDRRCIHDLLAGTKVIQLAEPAPIAVG
jgi:uncharacterized RDD family membrane protein YckC